MTRLMVLGLLRVKNMSGYEIQQLLQQSKTDTWAGILPGSIYHALKKMDKEGLVKVETLEQTGNRSKAIYAITSKGEEECQMLLLDAFSAQSVHLPSMLYTGMSLLTMHKDLIDVDKITQKLEEQKNLIEKQIVTVKAGREQKAMYVEIDELTQLTFDNMLDHYQLQMKFLEDIAETLKKNQA
ncbi:PadR family transcriptional regulator [Metabacillus litoralis]|uniref:PadR family transcriptional regulator n=1 Tax=Metabacillus litoralis TaxID=152268 RepID=A0A5C6W9Z6_9BACI|nr:PadR family transcriptional regulator [Metabacillus litoralis]TXC92652.1 PadR family transcriptional regulator [Metabacillus litoralis]